MNVSKGGEDIEKKKRRVRADVLLIAALLILSGAFFLVRYLRSAGGDVAAVYVDGRCTAVYPLSRDVTVDLDNGEGGVNVLVIADGAATVTDASCPDKICMYMGPIRDAGEMIVCLPNRTMIVIEGRGEAKVDVG